MLASTNNYIQGIGNCNEVLYPIHKYCLSDSKRIDETGIETSAYDLYVYLFIDFTTVNVRRMVWYGMVWYGMV